MRACASIAAVQKIRAKQPWIVLSAAEKFSLAGSHNPAISHFYAFTVDSRSEAVFAITDGCVDILFDCDTTAPGAEVYGTPMRAVDIPLKRSHRYFGVRFAPGVIPACFQVSAGELVEHHYSLLEVIPHTQKLFEEIVAEPDFSRQVAFFHDFLADKEKRRLGALTARVAREIVQHRGNLRMRELEVLTGYSLRSIERQFQAEMGITPKMFGRIVRCQAAVYQINHQSELTFSDLACSLGFSDQPHFLREFKKMVNATPLAYQRCVRHTNYSEKIHCWE